MSAATSSPSALVASPSISGQNSKHNHPTKSLNLCTTILQIKQLHSHRTRTTLAPSSPDLIAAYAKFATPESIRYAETALELFLKEEVEDEHDVEAELFVFNSLLRAYSSLGALDESVETFLRVLGRGLTPDRFTFPPLLVACAKASAFVEGIQLHGLLIKVGDVGGVGNDVFSLNSLIHLYSECGDLDSARKVFDGMRERNVVSWTSLIDGYARGGEPQEAVSLFVDMERMGKIKPNSVTMACVVTACAKLQDLDLGERIHTYIVDSQIELSTTLVNALVDMYMKCGAVEVAKSLFDGPVDRNIVLWNTMMSNYERLGMARAALNVFNEMLLLGMRPDRISVVAGISASAQLGDLMVGRTFHGYVLRDGLYEWDTVSDSVIDMYMKCGNPIAANRAFNVMQTKGVVAWNTIIAGCVKNGDLDSAWRLFDMMPRRNLVSWNTMISAMAQYSQFEKTITMFRELQKAGLNPDCVTLVAVASACGYLGTLNLAKWVYKFIEQNKILCDVKLGTAMVDMFARCGDPNNALRVFAKMNVKDVASWTAAIGAAAIKGDGRHALELFEDMIKQGVQPDSVVFVGVLTACSHGGLVEEGCMFFQSMSKLYGFAPQIIHYGCVVDMLGRAGLLEEARALIEAMPLEPNDVIWGALLSASRVRQKLEMAEYAAQHANALAPERSGVHVLLSNAYASAGRWQDVARVRLSLKNKGVRKPPGSSFIEVNGLIHEFTSGDDAHPRMAQITEMLQEMDARIYIAGHVPELANVLLDVSNEEKEHLLSRHSEKLAVAFGLISTCKGTPIRVAKNLRICLDCHSFMKLVSTVYDREVAIRDNHRFHFFKKGACSCGDYW